MSTHRLLSMTMDRRRFLYLTTATVAGAFTSACAPGERGSKEADVSVPQLLSVFGPDVVRDIGRRYRVAFADESSAPRLRASIGASHAGTGLIGRTQQSVADQVRTDFAEGRIVIVNGWVLSVTEARQCALYSILHG